MTVEPSYRIIVKGLAPNVDENAFELAFAKYGRIMEVHLARDPETKVSRSYGSITFECPEDCDDAIRGMNDQVFNGSKLSVQIAVDRSPSQPGLGAAGGFMGRYHINHQEKVHSEQPRRVQDQLGETLAQDFSKIDHGTSAWEQNWKQRPQSREDRQNSMQSGQICGMLDHQPSNNLDCRPNTDQVAAGNFDKSFVQWGFGKPPAAHQLPQRREPEYGQPDRKVIEQEYKLSNQDDFNERSMFEQKWRTQNDFETPSSKQCSTTVPPEYQCRSSYVPSFERDYAALELAKTVGSFCPDKIADPFRYDDARSLILQRSSQPAMFGQPLGKASDIREHGLPSFRFDASIPSHKGQNFSFSVQSSARGYEHGYGVINQLLPKQENPHVQPLFSAAQGVPQERSARSPTASHDVKTFIPGNFIAQALKPPSVTGMSSVRSDFPEQIDQLDKYDETGKSTMSTESEGTSEKHKKRKSSGKRSGPPGESPEGSQTKQKTRKKAVKRTDDPLCEPDNTTQKIKKPRKVSVKKKWTEEHLKLLKTIDPGDGSLPGWSIINSARERHPILAVYTKEQIKSRYVYWKQVGR